MSSISVMAELTPEARNQILIALAILMALVVVGGIAILLFRRHLRAEEEGGSANVGFSLSDLREMRDRGEITSEEYEATRMRVIASVKAGMAPKPPRKGGPLSGGGGASPGQSPRG